MAKQFKSLEAKMEKTQTLGEALGLFHLHYRKFGEQTTQGRNNTTYLVGTLEDDSYTDTFAKPAAKENHLIVFSYTNNRWRSIPIQYVTGVTKMKGLGYIEDLEQWPRK